MKPFYKHHYTKAVAPFKVNVQDIAGYITNDYARELTGSMLPEICFSVTVREEPADPEVGVFTETFEIDDVDVDQSGIDKELVLYKEDIVAAVEDYVFEHEDEIIGSSAVEKAFKNFYAARDAVRS